MVPLTLSKNLVPKGGDPYRKRKRKSNFAFFSKGEIGCEKEPEIWRKFVRECYNKGYNQGHTALVWPPKIVFNTVKLLRCVCIVLTSLPDQTRVYSLANKQKNSVFSKCVNNFISLYRVFNALTCMRIVFAWNFTENCSYYYSTMWDSWHGKYAALHTCTVRVLIFFKVWLQWPVKLTITSITTLMFSFKKNFVKLRLKCMCLTKFDDSRISTHAATSLQIWVFLKKYEKNIIFESLSTVPP